MIAKSCNGLTLAFVVFVALLAGCGSSGKPAVCTSVAGLKTDVQNLKDTNVRTEGLSAVSDRLTKVQQQLDTVKSDAKGQYSTQISDLSNALSALSSRVGAARDNLNGGTLTAMASAAGTAVQAGNKLVTAVSNTC